MAESRVDESIQVGLMRPLPLPDSLSVIELMREPLVAVLNAGHPLVEGSERGLYLAQLAQEPFVFFPRTYGSGQAVGLLATSGTLGTQVNTYA